MTTPANLKNLSPFGQSALALDGDFTEIERLAGQIEQLDIETEFGMAKAVQLLTHFSECGKRISEGVQSMAKSLEDARARTENAAQQVANRANLIHQRKQEEERGLEGFRALSEKVRAVTNEMGQLKKPEGEPISTEENARLSARMAGFDAQLAPLVEEALQLKERAREAKLKTLERNAESLTESLRHARRKLSVFSDSSGESATRH